MKIRSLFFKYQKEILTYANTEFGRAHLGIKDKDTVIKVTPDSFHILKDFSKGKFIVQATFYSRSPYLKVFDEVLTKMEIIEENGFNLRKFSKKESEFIIPQYLGFCLPKRYLPQIYLASGDPIYPDAHPESTSVDGWAGYSGGATNPGWSTVRGSAGNVCADNNTTYYAPYLQTYTTNWSRMHRAFFLFDTSSIPDEGVITSATFSMYPWADYNVSRNSLSSTNAGARLVTTTPDSNTAIVAADYQQQGTTAQASDIGYNDIAAGYNDWTLNSTGRGNISKTGVTKFGLRMVCDANNTNPSPAGFSSLATGWGCYYADNGSNKPKLVVVYSSIKKVNGVVYANIKKINGISIANIKKFMGVANV